MQIQLTLVVMIRTMNEWWAENFVTKVAMNFVTNVILKSCCCDKDWLWSCYRNKKRTKKENNTWKWRRKSETLTLKGKKRDKQSGNKKKKRRKVNFWEVNNFFKKKRIDFVERKKKKRKSEHIFVCTHQGKTRGKSRQIQKKKTKRLEVRVFFSPLLLKSHWPYFFFFNSHFGHWCYF